MSITQDWQAEIAARSILIGRGTNYPGIGGITGLGKGDPQTFDVPRYGDGDALGRHRRQSRTLVLPVKVLGSTQAGIWQNYRALADAWGTSTSDLQLDLRIPGAHETVVSYYGRPLGCPGDPVGLKGVLSTSAQFRAGPFCYGAARTASQVSTSIVIAAPDAGSAHALSSRGTLTFTGTGATPVFVNTTTGGVIQFALPVGSSVPVVCDLDAQTLTVGGVPAPGYLAVTSNWFGIPGGGCTVTVYGTTDTAITYQPAYEVP